MTSKGLLLASAIALVLSMTASGQELRNHPSYVGSAVFSAPPPLFHELAQFPTLETGVQQLKLAEIYEKLKAYAVHAVELIKSRLKGTETFVLAGMIGGGFVYLFNLVKTLFVGKCKTPQPTYNPLWMSKPHDNYGFNNNYYKSVDDDDEIDAATSRVWTALANGECLQKAACLLGKQTGRYNNANDIFRFLRRMPSQVVVDAFLKSADGYDDCTVYNCD